MNTITDLTARAVSFITTTQTTLLEGCIFLKREHEKERIEDEDKLSILNINPENFTTIMNGFISSYEEIKESYTDNKDNFAARAIELVWVSRNTPNVSLAVDYTVSICHALVNWIQHNEYISIPYMLETYGRYPTPFIWRELIRKILYEHTDERLKLASALEYLPIRIVLALGAGKMDSRKQRVLQMWNVEERFKTELLNDGEIKFLNDFNKEKTESYVKTLLTDGDKLFNELYQKEVPYSFETIFKAELEEIRDNRYWREREEFIATYENKTILKDKDNSEIRDPFQKAKEMNLYALTLSGGGIRSATFNLGIIQGFARKNLINKFDYLSTVSGGGYIGSWLTTWIKRDQSPVKVSNRLCPDKSPEPLGEELRPIRWLRMFSNYFAPDASIMSVDSWTIGITWLRNTLLNQVMIFLLLLGLLFTGNFLYEIWDYDIKGNINYSLYGIIDLSAALLLPISLLAGLGMHAYHSEGVPWIGIKREGTKKSKCIHLDYCLARSLFIKRLDVF